MAKSTSNKKQTATPVESQTLGITLTQPEPIDNTGQTVPPASTNVSPNTSVQENPAAGELPARTELTQTLVETKFKLELARDKYEEAFERFQNFVVTEDTMAKAQQIMTNARTFLRKFETIKDRLKKSAWDECKMWDNAYNSLKLPLEQEISKKQTELNKIAAEQARKKKIADDEKARTDTIKAAIDTFILEQSQAIASAKKPEELVAIEKLIGSHKANKARYVEFLPTLVTRCEALTDLIKNQKETIRSLIALEENLKAADTNGDDQAVIDLTEQKEKLEDKIEENKVLVQETAVDQATRPTNASITIGIPIHNTVKARRTAWKAELVKKSGSDELDPKELKKAFESGMLKCELDPAKVKANIDTLKGAGAFNGVTEKIVNGVRYFEEKLY